MLSPVSRALGEEAADPAGAICPLSADVVRLVCPSVAVTRHPRTECCSEQTNPPHSAQAGDAGGAGAMAGHTPAAPAQGVV